MAQKRRNKRGGKACDLSTSLVLVSLVNVRLTGEKPESARQWEGLVKGKASSDKCGHSTFGGKLAAI